MAVSNQDIINFLTTNPGMSDADIASAMAQYGVSPSQLASATGLSEGEVTSRLAQVVPQNQATLFGDTYVQPVYNSTGSGETFEQGPLENVITYKAADNQTGGAYQQYTSTGELERTGTQQKVDSNLGEFLAGSALLFGGLGGGFDGLFGGADTALGNGAFLGEGVPSGIGAWDTAYTTAGGLFDPAFALGVDGMVGTPAAGNGAFLGENVPTGISEWDAAFVNAGGVFDPTFALGTDGLVGTTLTPSVTPSVVAPSVTPKGTPITPALPPTVTPSVAPSITSVLPSVLTPSVIASLSGLLGGTVLAKTAGGGGTSTPTPVSIPTQGMPLNTQDYFNAIQQNYNQIMPNVPRDVASPLAAWYNSQYGA